MELMIIDPSGWKKPVQLSRAVSSLGSSGSNDIQIDSPLISPHQLQIIQSSESPSSCTVLNLGAPFVLRSEAGDRSLPTYATANLADGDEILLDDYRIIFRLPVAAGVLAASAFIEVALEIGDTYLAPHAPVVGRLVIRNIGSKPAGQLQVSVSGLPAECFRIDPIPLLYPGAQEEVRIRFFHRNHAPSAGVNTITLAVSAPASYPGEQVVIQQGLYAAPILAHQLELKDDMPIALPAASDPVDAPVVTVFDPPGDTETLVDGAPPATLSSDTPVESEPVLEGSAAGPQTPQPRLVRGPAESFWDDEK